MKSRKSGKLIIVSLGGYFMNNFSDLNDIKKIHENLDKKKITFEYNGSYENNLKHGVGSERLLGTDLTYNGSWSNGLFHGVGKLSKGNGKIEYEGEWSNCSAHGFGIIFRENNEILYKGYLSNNYPHGQGKTYNEDGNVVYEGRFVNGFLHGMGKEFNENGVLVYHGEFLNGLKSGFGVSYDELGELEDEGFWENGVRIKRNILEINEDKLFQATEKLNKLIGLDGVKKDILQLINYIKVKRVREEKGLKNPSLSLHLVFTGNPGTGKTTVARLVGEIYKELNILSKGHLVEVDRAALVGEYVGQTAPKVKKKIEEAMGGILFIDEAYTLSSDSGIDYGQEAINTLLKEMEDKRDEFIIIVAGYGNEMNTFIKSNPGLQSRFNKYIDFIDYTVEELTNIFVNAVAENDYVLDDGALDILCEYFEELVGSKNFANGRHVRNCFEKVLIAHSERIIKLNNMEDEVEKITLEDIMKALVLVKK